MEFYYFSFLLLFKLRAKFFRLNICLVLSASICLIMTYQLLCQK